MQLFHSDLTFYPFLVLIPYDIQSVGHEHAFRMLARWASDAADAEAIAKRIAAGRLHCIARRCAVTTTGKPQAISLADHTARMRRMDLIVLALEGSVRLNQCVLTVAYCGPDAEQAMKSARRSGRKALVAEIQHIVDENGQELPGLLWTREATTPAGTWTLAGQPT